MYRALYRKWRPKRFEDVIGQQSIVSALQNQIASQRVGHAYLFTGTRGTGKTTCAKIFAKAVNCLDKSGADPCGECSICKGIDDGSILDVVEIDAASNNGVDNIRDLREETVYTPASCTYKVYIIDEVHMLSIAAFNALLKVMEEPPSHVIFILATTEIHKVPATILSRCQRYDFARIRPEDIAARLSYIAQQEAFQLTLEAAELIARLADGAMRDALSILDTCAGVSATIDEQLVRQMAGVTDREYLFQISEALASNNASMALEQVAQLRQQSVDMKRLCEELIAHYRNLMLAALPGGKGLLSGVSPTEEKRYLEQAQTMPQPDSIRAIQILGDALEKMSRGTDQRIELELALFAISQPVQVTQPMAVAPAQAAHSTPAPFASAPVTAQAQPVAEPIPSTQVNSVYNAPAGDAIQPQQTTSQNQGDTAPASQGSSAPVEQTPAVEPASQPVGNSRVSTAAQGAVSTPPQLFEPWSKVVELLQQKDKMLYAYLEKSQAYCDGKRVLIDGSKTFRDFIRVNKESQTRLKELIEQVTGQRYGIGPYMQKSATATAGGHTIEDTLKELMAQGVNVVYNEK
ncbi:MAG: DNA polymerase III subunit gamma/tau [Candidatus Fournierella pullistercoris]|uniref:DNA-directed DNA polymerase n=1 Tax=Candidatus Allofournierella pullistercoris TaxID=2838597 RepID=A0A948T380_9FIRM|nr:DNA polymerase III subunit gamma/tau [Candidatus Fournierella pullistercoris]